MPKIIIDTPSMYGDHHVTEVRRLLFQLPGVATVYASSCFGVVEIEYDAALVTPERLHQVLHEAGYTEPLNFPMETGKAAYLQPESTPFRHTTMYQQLGRSVGFAQKSRADARAGWPCPGFGILTRTEAGDDGHG